jgi:hypothetical protein
LNHGGIIVLHDYFPDGKPLWPDEPPISGPYHALERLMSEARLTVLPLGELPWATKGESMMSSLAVVAQL